MEKINQLLQTAYERQKSNSDETSEFNMLSKLQIEWQEQAHSKIIFSLLNSGYVQDGCNLFFQLFLETLKLPRKFLGETWNVYREKAFDDGRIDFVLESESFCAIIEMKIEAGDGENQLARYNSYGKKKRKAYMIYYLTVDGHEPEEQSSSGIEQNGYKCISFQKEIIAWLQKCMECVEKDGYRYSFLKQYLGAVKEITGENNTMVNVMDLLDSSDMAKAAEIVADSFYEKMEAVQEQFFENLNFAIKRKTKWETFVYTNSMYVFLSGFTHRKHSYNVTLGLEIDGQLVIVIGFTEFDEDGDFHYIHLDKAEQTFPVVYREWTQKIELLENIGKFRCAPRSRWIYAEDSRGDKLTFKDYSAQIRLIEEMDLQCKFIAEYVVNHIINPLTTV